MDGSLKFSVDQLDTKEDKDSEDHMLSTFRVMKVMWDNEQFCDVVLQAGEETQRIPAHRFLLSACSKYFAALFTSPMQEADLPEVMLDEMRIEYLRPLVEFCYSGKIDIDAESVEGLLRASHRLQLPEVVAKCEEFMKINLATDNCLGVVAIAEQLDSAELQRFTEVYVFENFVQVCRSQEFLELTVEQVSKVIASDELTIFSEDVVFKSVMTWVQHDIVHRAKHISQLLENVRLPLLSASFLTEHAWAFCEDHGWLRLLKEVVMKHTMPTTQIQSARAKPRQQFKENLLAVIAESSKHRLIIERYCPLWDEWSFVGQICLWRNWFSIAMLDGKLIILGGNDKNRNVTNVVESYDLDTHICEPLSSMLTKRQLFGVAVLDGLLYAVGGINGLDKLNSVERYDPTFGIWEYVSSLNYPTTTEVAVLDGLIYAVGISEELEAYDAKKDIWIIKANTIIKRDYVGVAADLRYLYVLGGRYDNRSVNTVERYDPLINEWQIICSLSSARHNISCAFLGNRLMAVGGRIDGGIDWTNKVECISAKTNTCTQLQLIKHNSFVKCALLVQE